MEKLLWVPLVILMIVLLLFLVYVVVRVASLAVRRTFEDARNRSVLKPRRGKE